MMKIWQLLISGRVQGVCFRFSVEQFVRDNAPLVKGFVRNLVDGRVEVFAVGELDDLNELYNFCRRGPSGSMVENVQLVEKNTAPEFESFTILRS